jgi:hypothetical protein
MSDTDSELPDFDEVISACFDAVTAAKKVVSIAQIHDEVTRRLERMTETSKA